MGFIKRSCTQTAQSAVPRKSEKPRHGFVWCFGRVIAELTAFPCSFMQVEMKCSETEHVSITDVEEPATCEYLMSISCPQACGWDARVPTSTPIQTDAPSLQSDAVDASSHAALSLAATGELGVVDRGATAAS
jgi:hypothetical protein